jgi:hypothetical protein
MIDDNDAVMISFSIMITAIILLALGLAHFYG